MPRDSLLPLFTILRVELVRELRAAEVAARLKPSRRAQNKLAKLRLELDALDENIRTAR